jgi:ubiquinone/menaquinone biosynthesis C-methylase UbiE
VQTPSKSTTGDQKSFWQGLVTLGFRLLYREFAWSYDLVAWLVSLGQWQNWGRSAFPHLVGERILELGHGPGHLLRALAERECHAVGIDASQQMTQIAAQRLRRSDLPLTLVHGHAQVLPFPSHSFDSVIATFPTSYIADKSTLAEVARVLKPKGRLVVVLGARLSGRDPVSCFIEWLYTVTGQREALDFSAWQVRFSGAELTIRPLRVELKHSEVFLLIAEPCVDHTYPTPRDTG